jgi:hypothetical protein
MCTENNFVQRTLRGRRSLQAPPIGQKLCISLYKIFNISLGYAFQLNTVFFMEHTSGLCYEAEVFRTFFQTRDVQQIIFHHFSRIVRQLLKIEFYEFMNKGVSKGKRVQVDELTYIVNVFNDFFISVASELEKWICRRLIQAFGKVARVTPIYKEGNKEEALNYRPISVFFVYSKLCDTSINNRLNFKKTLILRRQLSICSIRSL